MDSPETTAKTAATNSAATATAATSSSSSPPVQESPFSNFLSNLSPIEPVRAPHVLQGILGLNSPPLVFTSPHINALQETSFLKRLQRPSFHQLPGAEASQNDDEGRKLADAPGDPEKSDSLLDSRLITETQKNTDIRSYLQVQFSSSSGCVNAYLAEPVDIDGANSAHRVNRNLKASAALQSSTSGRTEKTLSKFYDKNDQELKVDGAVAVFGEAGDSLQGKSTCDNKPIRNEEDNTCGVWPSDECPKMESNLSSDHVSKKQQCQNSSAQNAGGVPGDETHCPPEWLPEPLQTLQTYEDSRGNAGAIPHESLDNAMNDSEASKHQRGMSRRCLQFEEAQPKATVDRKNSSRSPATSVESESLDSPHADLNATSSKRQLANLPQLVTPMFPPRHTGKFPITVSKPSGIGLHLNSIVNALPKGHGATVSVKSASADHGMLETKESIAVNSFISESVDDMGPMNWLPPVDHNATPHSKRNFNSVQSESFEEFSQLSPKTKRKKSSSTIDGDGCKRCNCKKTRCLKLYCDCFAAGIYCAEPCSCQGCFNRPEYEETVLETRQQIESRNPLAFAPKIVQRVTEFSDDGNCFTPSSARHKRGCNCKKSRCLKKYCECYQANVGCSSGCRCEGCKNVYGRKEEYDGNEEMMSKRARPEDTSGYHNLTPLTPQFECSDHGKDTLKSRILSSRYVPSPSPESDLAILSSYAKTPRTLKISDSNDMLLETRKEILDVDYYGQGRDYNSMHAVDQFSSRYQELADLCDFTVLQDFPSSAVASSASSKATDWTNVSRIQLCPRSSGLSSGGSLRWRSSPLTPMTQLGGSKNLQALDSNSRLSGTMEDDTPEILKDASTPIKSVKVSSPSRKRVSPPHGHRHELGSSSSGALKSGRKFILKALPSFPPLTPCIDSKGSNYEEKSNFQENKQ